MKTRDPFSFPVSEAVWKVISSGPQPPNTLAGFGVSMAGLLFGGAIMGVSISAELAITLLFRYAKKCRRRGFYEREARRRPSHKIRVRTTRSTHIPTPEEILAQWEIAKHRNNNLEKIRLGAMLADVESTVDNALVRDESGDIVGRHPGLKGWFREHCRQLLPHYKTLMRYKSMADKLQKISGLEDPDPVLVVLPAPTPKTAKNKRDKDVIENSAEQLQHVGKKEVVKEGIPEWAKGERFRAARKRVREIMETPRTLHGLENEMFLTLGIMREIRPREAGYVRCGRHNRMRIRSA